MSARHVGVEDCHGEGSVLCVASRVCISTANLVRVSAWPYSTAMRAAIVNRSSRATKRKSHYSQFSIDTEFRVAFLFFLFAIHDSSVEKS